MSISDRVYKELYDFMHSGAGYAGPFVPYVGPAWDAQDGPRIMFCGKATNGEWSYGKGAKKAKECADNFIRNNIIPKNFTSAYWHFATDLLSHLYKKEYAHDGGHEDRIYCFDRLCWTNVTKLALTDGNLPIPILNPATEIMANILKGEIETLKPDAIVFVTSSYGDNILDKIGLGSLNYVDDAVLGYKYSRKYECHVFKTRHPQGWSSEQRNLARDYIVRTIKSSRS